jgi:hypothetical protein
MTIINIEIGSIKKNKNAGATRTSTYGATSINFKYKNVPKEFLNDMLTMDEGIIIMSWFDGFSGDIEGILLHDGLIKLLPKNYPYAVNVDKDAIMHNHAPIPKYSYSYRVDTLVKCEVCRKDVKYMEIGKAEDSEDSEGYKEDECPNCKALNSFKYTFQKIEDVITEIDEKN